MPCTLYLTNLPFTLTDEDELGRLIADALGLKDNNDLPQGEGQEEEVSAKIAQVRIITDKNGKAKGYTCTETCFYL